MQKYARRRQPELYPTFQKYKDANKLKLTLTKLKSRLDLKEDLKIYEVGYLIVNSGKWRDTVFLVQEQR